MLLLLACATKLGDDTAATDDTGDTATADCTFLPVDDRLVLEDACVDGVCGGTMYPDAVLALGEPDTCAADHGVASCAWGDVTVSFPDCDHDGAPDEAYVCDLYEQTIVIMGSWDGASPEGLGLGVPGTCWTEALGPMDGSGWNLGENPWVHVGIVPSEGPVTSIYLTWNLEE